MAQLCNSLVNLGPFFLSCAHLQECVLVNRIGQRPETALRVAFASCIIGFTIRITAEVKDS